MGSVREALAGGVRQLAGAGVADADREAAWLLAHVLNCSAGALRARGSEPLAPAHAGQFGALVRRRADREPIQYILGTEEFMGMTFRVTPAVLIPRFDTETLVRAAAAALAGRPAPRVADIGTGSGAIAVGIATLVPASVVVATDLSLDALAVARQNATVNGVTGRVSFRQGDLLEPLRGEPFDAILSNPPYIGEAELPGLEPEVREWEPRLALTPGPDGLAIFRRLAAGAGALLTPGGLLGVEVGLGQARPVAALFAEAGLARVQVYEDTAGIERAVLARA